MMNSDSIKRKASPPGDDTGSKKLKRQWRTPRKAQQNRPPPAKIESGDAGIWITCAKGKEGKSTVELRDLLEEYAAKLYNTQAAVAIDESEATLELDEGEGVTADDIEASIKDEVKDIKQHLTPSSRKQESLFQAVKLDTQCVLFFKTTSPVDPVSFVHKICQDARDGVSQRRCRFVKRLTPMTKMGKATMDGLEGICDDVLANGIGVEGSKYAIRPTIRNHNVLKRDELIQTIARHVAQTGESYKVDLKQPDVVILVEVYRNVLGMSIVTGEYESLKRYNLAEILEPTTSQRAQDSNTKSTEKDDAQIAQS